MLDRNLWRCMIATASKLDRGMLPMQSRSRRFSLRNWLSIIEDEQFESFLGDFVNGDGERDKEKLFDVNVPPAALMVSGLTAFVVMVNATELFERIRGTSDAA